MRPSNDKWPQTSSLAADVVVLCSNAPTESDRRAYEIASFLGARVEFAVLSSAALEEGTSNRELVARCKCIVVEAETLARMAEEMPAACEGLRDLFDQAEHVFVYGFRPLDRHDAVLVSLSAGVLAGTRPTPDASATLHVAKDQKEWCFQFSGLSIGEIDSTKQNTFVQGSAQVSQSVLMWNGKQPYFVCTESGGSRLCFVAGGELADLDHKLSRHSSCLKWFCGLVPLMMFLRMALRDRVWHNDHPRACFIIDDPLLKSRHGFLEYERLLGSMRRQRFSTCIAFIPLNFRRSDKKVAELFASNDQKASLCIHGCDHIGAEFESRDYELLRGKAQLALERMRTHRTLSGLSFDEVMVFPQGLFSAEALAALKASEYLAAVNTELGPSDAPETTPLRDLLDVAVTRFSDFPLFGRRYPHDLAEFAFDLFMGKAALVAEHHGYFRHGYGELESFVTSLNALDDRLEWTNLETICSHACLSKTADNGDIHVRFFTDRFSLQHTGQDTKRYVLIRQHGSNRLLPHVTVDGCPSALATRAGNSFEIPLLLNPGQKAQIRILGDTSDSVGLPWRPTRLHNARARLRRFLCEIRDNFVDTNRVLNGVATTARNVLAGRRFTKSAGTVLRHEANGCIALKPSVFLDR